MVRQSRELQRVAEPAPFAQAELFFEQEVDEVEVTHLRGLGAADEFGDYLSQVDQPELGGGLTDPVGGQTAHRHCSVFSVVCWVVLWTAARAYSLSGRLATAMLACRRANSEDNGSSPPVVGSGIG